MPLLGRRLHGQPLASFRWHRANDCSDIVIVQINPVVRRGTPMNAHDIQNRMNEIAFNASLLKELRSIDFVARLIEEGRLGATDLAATSGST